MKNLGELDNIMTQHSGLAKSQEEFPLAFPDCDVANTLPVYRVIKNLQKEVEALGKLGNLDQTNLVNKNFSNWAIDVLNNGLKSEFIKIHNFSKHFSKI